MIAIRVAARRWLLATTTLAGLAALGGAARAQPSEGGTANVQEVIVTAQRRSERLQDVPMSVTALPADTLEKAGVANTADLARVTPGLNMSSYGNNLQPAVRGVTSTGGNLGDNPSVAIYLDGVYQPQQIAALFDLPDVRQIEVLKGPQGALYGQNATGGAITITTLSPSFTTTGKLSASYGNRNAVALRGFASGPVSDQVAVSLAAAYQNRDGFRRHVITGERDRGLESKLVRGKVLFEPSKDARITLSGYYADRDDSAAYAGVALNGNSVGYAFIPTAPRTTSPKQFSAYPDVFNRVKSWGVNARGEFELGPGTLSTVTAYTRTKIVYVSDLDASAVNFAEYRTPDLNGKYFVQEATFVSNKFGRTSFLFGGLYLNGRDNFNPGEFILRSPNLPPAPLTAPTLHLFQFGRVKKEILAAYGEVSLDVTDKLVLTAGGRYTHETQRGYHTDALTPTPPASLTPFLGNPEKWSKFSPRVTARYEVGPRANLYATFATGFKGGLINTATLADAVDPETIKSYEAGYKGRPLENLTLNIAGFWYDYKNLQVVAYRAPLLITQNAASARGKGVDLDATWSVTPEFTLSGGLEYLDARYRRFPDALVFTPTGFGNLATTGNLSGRRLLRSPKWSGNLTANYQADMASGRVGAFLSLYHSAAFGLEGSNRLRQGAYTTVDGEVSFAPSAVQGLRLVLWGKNLGDKAYLTSAVASELGDLGSYAEPRTFGVRAEYSF